MKITTLVPAILLPIVTSGQTTSPDSTQQLKEVVVRAYFTEQPLLRSPASVSIISRSDLENHPAGSLVPSLNSAPGVRMEERSPGSYRLSIRGSLLRSPFGIRNVRIYLDEIPFTDAGGNTYLNSLDPGSIGGMTILKGAEASIYGANTGGVILIGQPAKRPEGDRLGASFTGGSYQSFHQQLNFRKQRNNDHTEFMEGYQTSRGYRQNSELKRLYSHLAQRWQYSPRAEIRARFLFSDLRYQTPGGLTRAQADLSPASARPATATLPGAVEQKAGIYNTTLLGGLIHEFAIRPELRHVLGVSGTRTDFRNPFITNYETRLEKTLGVRTYLEYTRENPGWNWKASVGGEAQFTSSDIRNFDNAGGEKAAEQSSDKLLAGQQFLFAHWRAGISRKLVLETSVSYNFYRYDYQTLFPVISPENTRKLPHRLIPRVAAAFQLNENWGWRASVSGGYSTPTLAEVRASDNVINTGLNAESGWNYETGLRFFSNNNRIYADANVFSFRLKDAIVRRISPAEAEYFVNAGGTDQKGLEFQALAWLIPQRTGRLVTGLQLRNSYSYSHFRFTDYISGQENYSGNRLTGVPRNVVVTSLKLDLAAFSIFGQYNYTSAIPLNDAGTAFAEGYHLVQLKGTWRFRSRNNNYFFETFAGIDNLLDVSYSLGNDLNAVGGRYFNYSAPRNYYAGLAINFNKP
ncbi:MAG TPA: TonB-dependent receptor [Sphingobacteriaceae bacterium]